MGNTFLYVQNTRDRERVVEKSVDGQLRLTKRYVGPAAQIRYSENVCILFLNNKINFKKKIPEHKINLKLYFAAPKMALFSKK